MDMALRHMSNARRHLFTKHPEGDVRAFALAVDEVRLALVAMDATSIESAYAREWVRILRAAVEGGPLDSSAFVDAVDELASWLFWNDPVLA